MGTSRSNEDLLALRLGFGIFCLGACWLALTVPPRTGPRNDRLPYERFFAELAGPDQRVFRELQEGEVEAENRRAATGAWPPVDALAADLVPPFAADAIAARDGYHWTMARDGLLVDYLGIPSAADRPAFLLQLAEPDPAAPPDPRTPPDETHHKLPDGTILHVTTWMHDPTPKAPERFVALPLAEGWNQVTIRAPSS